MKCWIQFSVFTVSWLARRNTSSFHLGISRVEEEREVFGGVSLFVNLEYLTSCGWKSVTEVGRGCLIRCGNDVINPPI